MIYVASCSFGKDSLAQIILAKIYNEPIDYVLYSEVMYDDKISGEIPEQRDFIYNVAIPKLESWGYKVIIVRADSTFKDNFFKVIKNSKTKERNGKMRGFPMSGKCAINRDCKIPPIQRWYKEHGHEEVTQYVGIAIDEPKRLKKLEGTNKVSLLAKYGYTEQMAKELCIEYGLLSPIYSFTNRGGCFFCPNCNDKELRHLRTHHRELFDDLLELEKTEGIVGQNFKAYQETSLKEIDERFYWEEQQIDIFAAFPGCIPDSMK